MENDRRLVKLDPQLIERFESEEMLMIKGGSVWTWIKGIFTGETEINVFNCENCKGCSCTTNNGC
ncbi:MAG: hypothetical protein PHD06_03075 [Bacteroidales bacterium]|jgi:hypothetical protein|nr:hypothetical protein [Bacteroidales bacterium]MDY0198421.1 hypothetical protein [Tenuifilaceae bacterium]